MHIIGNSQQIKCFYSSIVFLCGLDCERFIFAVKRTILSAALKKLFLISLFKFTC